MKVIVEINRCRQCNHIGNCGTFTGGAPIKWRCEHPEVMEIVKSISSKDRIISQPDENFIPVFCPMLHGRSYQ